MQNILIIDDDSEMLNCLEQLLSTLSCNIYKTTNICDAQKIIQKVIPSVILLDLDLPPFSGYDILRILRNDPLLSVIPIIVVSGYDAKCEKVKAIERGADEYLQKPINTKLTLNIVKTQLRINRVKNALSDRERTIVLGDSIQDGLVEIDRNYHIIWTNKQFQKIFQKLKAKCLDALFEDNKVIVKNGESLKRFFQQQPNTSIYIWINGLESELSCLFCVSSINIKTGFENENCLLQIKSLNKKVKKFTSMILFEHFVAHKLNTPMNQLLLPLQMIKTDIMLTDHSKELVDMAYNAANELHLIHTTILEYINTTKIKEYESSSISLLEIQGVIKDTFEKYNVLFEVNTHVAVPFHLVFIDTQTLLVVLSEIIENSKKYCSQKNPQFDVVVSTYDNGTLQISISDNGTLDPTINYATSLEPYLQLDEHGLNSMNGMGLGLTKMQLLLWKFNGELSVKTLRPNYGFTVVIQLKSAIRNDHHARNN